MSDISSILLSFSSSIPYIEKLTTGFGYVLGISLIIYSFEQLYLLADRYTKHSVKSGFFTPVAYFLAGAALLFLPSSIDTLETTLFGTDNPLSYSSTPTPSDYMNPATIVPSIFQMIGLIWFVRGCSLLASSSDPGVQHGKRGFFFVIGGILAMNFVDTYAIIANAIKSFVSTQHNLYPIHYIINSWF